MEFVLSDVNISKILPAPSGLGIMDLLGNWLASLRESHDNTNADCDQILFGLRFFESSVNGC